MGKFMFYVGIDVSRNKLDFAILRSQKILYHKEIANTVDSVQALLSELQTVSGFALKKTVFGIEHTGIYTSHLLTVLKKAKANVVLEDALEIRNSLGKTRGKYDKLDAIRIATYLFKCKEDLTLWQPRRQVIEDLHHLSTLRSRLIGMSNAMKMPLKELKAFLRPELSDKHDLLCYGTMQSLKKDIESIDALIINTVKGDHRISRLYDIITSIPNVGPVTALLMIVTTNEFKDITDPKKYASYAGIAPFKKESGIVKGKSMVSHLANKRAKAILHIIAMSSISTKSELRDYYIRKTEVDGKPKMAVLNAIRNKLILRIFACVHQDRLYEKNYDRSNYQNDNKSTKPFI
ncbi:IS110 family transposase [Mucilaginibacter terrenus]|uniref:IS110 family transposase n=1 Tax=Mucilaginibacter terrenus TaxID=2482727 RepID=A0A3E2NLI3_9SPHI|nr:transposase [Mucilaginibacter terrenus]RFZ81859.1 IS110 family transposase [Mucilaginibacter terrenus]